MAISIHNRSDRLRHMLVAAIVFFVISSPWLYRLTASILGSWVASPAGTPTVYGLVLHTAVFACIAYGLMCVKF